LIKDDSKQKRWKTFRRYSGISKLAGSTYGLVLRVHLERDLCMVRRWISEFGVQCHARQAPFAQPSLAWTTTLEKVLKIILRASTGFSQEYYLFALIFVFKVPELTRKSFGSLGHHSRCQTKTQVNYLCYYLLWIPLCGNFYGFLRNFFSLRGNPIVHNTSRFFVAGKLVRFRTLTTAILPFNPGSLFEICMSWWFVHEIARVTLKANKNKRVRCLGIWRLPFGRVTRNFQDCVSGVRNHFEFIWFAVRCKKSNFSSNCEGWPTLTKFHDRVSKQGPEICAISLVWS